MSEEVHVVCTTICSLSDFTDHDTKPLKLTEETFEYQVLMHFQIWIWDGNWDIEIKTSEGS